VESRAAFDVENLYLSSEVPAQYLLERERYRVKIAIDLTSYDPQAVIEVQGAGEVVVAFRPEPFVRAGRARPCGSYDAFKGDRQRFMFSWVICGEDADASEFVVAFDIFDEMGSLVGEERIPFELKRNGVFWASDSL
jgi:hypothetical protein